MRQIPVCQTEKIAVLKGESMEKSITFCGLVCSQCPVYIATKTNHEELKEKLAIEYSTDTFEFVKEDMNCTGCHSVVGVNEKMCKECLMRKCGMHKSISHCAECNEYPCQYINSYVPTGSDNRKMLDELVKK